MIKYTTLVELLEQASSGVSFLDMPMIGMPYQSVLRDFCHIGLRLPRRSGKSTAARTLHSNTSSLLYTKYGGTRFDLDREEFRFRGKPFYGMKIKYIILDDCEEVFPELVVLIVGTLLPAGLLDRNFKVVSLYT